MSEIGEVISGLRSHLVRFGPFVHIFGEKDSELIFLGVIEHQMFAKHSFAKILDCLHANIHIEMRSSRSILIGDSKAGKQKSCIHVANRSFGFPIEGPEEGKGFRIKQNYYKAERNRKDLSEFNQYVEHIVFAPTSSLILLKPTEMSGEKTVPDAYYSLKQGHVVVEDSWGSNDTFLLSKSAIDGKLVLESVKEVDRINKTINLYAKLGHIMMCTNSPNNERMQLLLVGSGGYRSSQQHSPDSTVAITEKHVTRKRLIYSFWADGCYIQYGSKLFILTPDSPRPIIEINLWETFITHQLSIQTLQNLICDRTDVWRGCLRIGHAKQCIDLGIVQLSASRLHLTVNGYVSSLRQGPINHKNHTRTMFEDIDKSRAFKNRQKYQIGMAKLDKQYPNDTFPVDLNGTKHSIRLSNESRVFILTSMNATETMRGKIFRVKPNSYMLVSGHLIIVSSNQEGMQSIAVCKRGFAKNIQLLSGSHVLIAGRNGHLLFIGKNEINIFDWTRTQHKKTSEQKNNGENCAKKVTSKAIGTDPKRKTANIDRKNEIKSKNALKVANQRIKSVAKQTTIKKKINRDDRIKHKIKLVLKPNRKIVKNNRNVKSVTKSRPTKTESPLNRKISSAVKSKKISTRIKTKKIDRKRMIDNRKSLNVLHKKSSNAKQNSKTRGKFQLRTKLKKKSSRY